MKISAILQTIRDKESLAGALKAVAHELQEKETKSKIDELKPMGITHEGVFNVADLMLRAAKEIEGEAIKLNRQLNEIDIDWWVI